MSGVQAEPSVLVGIDSSAAARHAALWAVDEAVSRDIPLRLVHVLEGGDCDRDSTARQRADAGRVMCRVIKALEATEKPVKIESDVVKGGAAGTLIRLSRQAVMLCLGAVGSNPMKHGVVGSTTTAVAGSAHCAVAIVHGAPPARQASASVIVAAVDDSPDNGVLLQTAVFEAALRRAPLRVITCWQPPRADPAATTAGDRRICAQLDRRLARWRHLYPNVRVEHAATHTNLSEYVTTHAAQLQMLVVSARSPGHVREVSGPAGNIALRSSDCTVLIVDHQHL